MSFPLLTIVLRPGIGLLLEIAEDDEPDVDDASVDATIAEGLTRRAENQEAGVGPTDRNGLDSIFVGLRSSNP